MTLLRGLVARPLRGAVHGVRHLAPVAFEQATGSVLAVYEQLEADFGVLAPPIALHAPAPELLAASWAVLRETLLVDGNLSRAEKEAVAAAVSEVNTCPYCEGIHGAARDTLDPDTEWAALHPWLAGAPGPCPSRAPAETVGVAVTFHYLNRVVNVFLDDAPVPDDAPDVARRAANRLLTWLSTAADLEPGRSLPLLSPARGSTPRHPATRAFGAAAGAFERAGRRSVPAPVRAAVLASLDVRPDGPWWVADAVAGLDPPWRPVARLALLVARESYRVDDDVVLAARSAGRLDDRDLAELVGWSAFAAARRLGADLLDRVARESVQGAA